MIAYNPMKASKTIEQNAQTGLGVIFRFNLIDQELIFHYQIYVWMVLTLYWGSASLSTSIYTSWNDDAKKSALSIIYSNYYFMLKTAEQLSMSDRNLEYWNYK